MKKLLFLLLLLPLQPVAAQYRQPVEPTRNLILMVADGTSLGVISAARWLKIYRGEGDALAIDPWMCGTMRTFSSNAPIGDSAPTTSAYMTGMPSRTGFVSTYPPADPGNDLVEIDPTRAYRPLATVLEAARQQHGRATGLVVTVEFPHATPADCSAHSYDRDRYDWIAPQMAFQDLDVLFGGGNSLLSEPMKAHLRSTGTRLLQDDIDGFRRFDGTEKVWALFGERELPYELDRDSTRVPSLREMTQKALARLSRNENGFFLMVEGSKIDWAAHANDAATCLNEFLAFDRAVEAAIDFARADGNTTVVVLSDHGNSGLTIGRRDLPAYDTATLEQLFGPVSRYRHSAELLARMLAQGADPQTLFREQAGISLTDEQIGTLRQTGSQRDYMHVSGLIAAVSDILNAHTFFGFTTGGHTGEEVFLAAYHPAGDVPMGVNTNMDIHRYLCAAAAIDPAALTDAIFVPHQEVFRGLSYTVDGTTLTVRKGRHRLVIPAFASEVELDGLRQPIGSVVVYVDKTGTFYLPRALAEWL